MGVSRQCARWLSARIGRACPSPRSVGWIERLSLSERHIRVRIPSIALIDLPDLDGPKPGELSRYHRVVCWEVESLPIALGCVAVLGDVALQYLIGFTIDEADQTIFVYRPVLIAHFSALRVGKTGPLTAILTGSYGFCKAATSS